MTKAELRVLYKRKRAKLTAKEVAAIHGGILDQLFNMDWKGTAYLHTFLPIARHKEPDMWPFIAHMQIAHPEIQLVVSRSEPVHATMQHFLLTDEMEWGESVWGIVEPVAGKPVAESLLDAVLVPLLAVDKIGNRVGYGKGYYDRFLALCRPDCRKIGVSLFDPVEEEIEDINPLDVPLDLIVTPSNRYVVRSPK